MTLAGHRVALLAAARAAMVHAYAPYSRYRVGAAVLDEAGRIWRGANVENASYGLTLCAERAAVCAAVAGGARRVYAVAVAVEAGPPPYPCGACRQVLAEFAPAATPVWIAAGRRVRCVELGRLLPCAFSLSPSACASEGSADVRRSRAQPRSRRWSG